MALFTARFCILVAFLWSLSVKLAHGQATASSTTTSSAPPTETSTDATVFPGTMNWEYYGCYNETTYVNAAGNVRALAGVTKAQDDMTVEVCLDYCRGNGLAFAGLEYTRECYCAQHVNSLSNKLPDPECNLACMGNDTQICGGALRLTVYQTKSSSSTKGAGSKIAREAPVGSILALGIAMGTLLCLA